MIVFPFIALAVVAMLNWLGLTAISLNWTAALSTAVTFACVVWSRLTEVPTPQSVETDQAWEDHASNTW